MMKGAAKKLTVYVDEKDKFHHKLVYEAVVDILYKKKIVGVSVFRGIAGYGTDGVLHTSKMLELSTDMPVKIEAVDTEEKINLVLPDIYQVVEKGLVEVVDTQVIKCCRQEEMPKESERMKLEGQAKMLRVIVSEDDEWEGEPLYEAIAKRLILEDIAGATVYKGLAGYGPHRRYHKSKRLAGKGELPVLLTVVDTEANVNRVLPILDDFVQEGIVIVSDVDVIRYTHRDSGSEIPLS